MISAASTSKSTLSTCVGVFSVGKDDVGFEGSMASETGRAVCEAEVVLVAEPIVEVFMLRE